MGHPELSPLDAAAGPATAGDAGGVWPEGHTAGTAGYAVILGGSSCRGVASWPGLTWHRIHASCRPEAIALIFAHVPEHTLSVLKGILFSLPHRRTRPRSGHDCRVDAAGPSLLRVSRRPCLRAQLFYGRASRRHVCGVETSPPPVASPLSPAVPVPFWRLRLTGHAVVARCPERKLSTLTIQW